MKRVCASALCSTSKLRNKTSEQNFGTESSWSHPEQHIFLIFSLRAYSTENNNLLYGHSQDAPRRHEMRPKTQGSITNTSLQQKSLATRGIRSASRRQLFLTGWKFEMGAQLQLDARLAATPTLGLWGSEFPTTVASGIFTDQSCTVYVPLAECVTMEK